MAHDPKKKQRLSDFDFSSPDAHVAIVGKAANGKEKFLVMKSLNEKIEKAVDPYTQAYIDGLLADAADNEAKAAKADKVYVEMPLEDLLRTFMGMWGDQAQSIAASVVMKSITDDQKDALRKALLAKMQSGSNRSGAAETTDSAESLNKSKETTMTDKAPEQVDVTKALADRDAKIADLQKSLDALKAKDEAAELAKFEVVAKSLETLGAKVEDAKVLKAVAAIEGGKAVLDMLTKAADLLAKSAKLNEQGSGLSADADDKGAKLDSLAKSYAKENKVTFAAAMVAVAEQHPELR